AAGIPTWSPTVVLICRSTAYVWQSGRDAQFSADCGRIHHGSVPFKGRGSVSIKISRDGKLIIQMDGESITDSCTNEIENWNSWVDSASATGSGSGPGSPFIASSSTLKTTTTTPASTPTGGSGSLCIAGTGNGNLARL
ncbi:hypothetical protein KCU77_g3452, partial [Aureobasidium melanogenum]